MELRLKLTFGVSRARESTLVRRDRRRFAKSIATKLKVQLRYHQSFCSVLPVAFSSIFQTKVCVRSAKLFASSNCESIIIIAGLV